MAENQPPNIVEGATTGDIDEEVPVAAKSAEDRKAAAALSSLDAPRDDDSGAKDVDREAVRKAMDRLAGSGATNGTTAKKEGDKQASKKTIKVDQADVTFLVSLVSTIYALWVPEISLSTSIIAIGPVSNRQPFLYNVPKHMSLKTCMLTLTAQVDELELSKIKATELLRAHDGSVASALKAYITPAADAQA
jgi:hypothetical protein